MSMPAPIPPIRFHRALEAAQIANLLPGPYVFSAYRCRSAAVATNKCPILAVSRRRPHRRVPRDRSRSWMPSPAKPGSSPTKCRLRNMVRPEQMPFDNVVGKHFDSGDHPECLRRAVEAIRLSEVRRGRSSPSRTDA